MKKLVWVAVILATIGTLAFATARVLDKRPKGDAAGVEVVLPDSRGVDQSARLDVENIIVRSKDDGAGIPRIADVECLRVVRSRRSVPIEEDRWLRMGLSTCKRIIEAQGGTIEVEMIFGHGKSFVVIFRDVGQNRLDLQGRA